VSPAPLACPEPDSEGAIPVDQSDLSAVHLVEASMRERQLERRHRLSVASARMLRVEHATRCASIVVCPRSALFHLFPGEQMGPVVAVKV
jgi:hypothetical protein